jgi:hypothetical protein
VTTEYTYYLTWTYKRASGLSFEAGTLTFPYQVTTLDGIQRIQDALRADGKHEAIVLGFSLLNTRSAG